jgi:HAD superfamily hydrolase (TIGR01509 family)
MSDLRGVIWDVDGVLAETERDGHRVAFNLAFEERGLPWRWDERYYGALLRVSGGRERMLWDMARRADAPRGPGEREALARELHARKNAIYAEIVGEGHVPLREGVAALMDECLARGVRMAIATTTSRSNLEALMGFHLGAAWRELFTAVVCGEDVVNKKPDPEVYVKTLRRLGESPLHCVAIEDSPGGVAAAHAADVPVLVTRSAYFADATLEDAIAIGPGLQERRGWRPLAGGDGAGRIRLEDIEGWHARSDLVSQYA